MTGKRHKGRDKRTGAAKRTWRALRDYLEGSSSSDSSSAEEDTMSPGSLLKYLKEKAKKKQEQKGIIRSSPVDLEKRRQSEAKSQNGNSHIGKSRVGISGRAALLRSGDRAAVLRIGDRAGRVQLRQGGQRQVSGLVLPVPGKRLLPYQVKARVHHQKSMLQMRKVKL